MAWTRPIVVVLLPSPRGVGVILRSIRKELRKKLPSDVDVVAITAMFKTLHDVQTNLCLVSSVQLDFVVQDANFVSDYLYMLRHGCSRNVDIAGDRLQDLEGENFYFAGNGLFVEALGCDDDILEH